MNRYRVSIRFRKEGDLRLIGHWDPVRAYERLFRRTRFQLRMTDSFLPELRMQSAAVSGRKLEDADEVAEIELTEPLSAEELLETFPLQPPQGKVVADVDPPPAFPVAGRLHYLESLDPRQPFSTGRRGECHAAFARVASSEGTSQSIARRVAQEPLGIQGKNRLPAVSNDRWPFGRAPRRSRRARPGQPGIARPQSQTNLGGDRVIMLAFWSLARPLMRIVSHPERTHSHEKGNARQCVATGRVPDCHH
ncbi:DUF2344 domain-containing protein [Lignipirellula cremea]|uniref:DUF2344 domain-containing protein n=1 Tax=Lignipirellula cremea TaxID=2528010 RepID=A0A518DSS5_9BACT|nr:hypothetical protein Pla8534_26980 [Lignipirellula cremea]